MKIYNFEPQDKTPSDIKIRIEQALIEEKVPAISFDRVSSQRQADEGYSLGNQWQSAAQYAERNNLYIVQSFSIAESSWHAQNRKMFKAMLQSAKINGIKHLIFKCVDRMSRNFADLDTIMNMITFEGYTVHFYEGGGKSIDKSSSHSDKMIIGMEATVAKHHSDKTSYDILEMNRKKAARGVAPGIPRPGYTYDTNAKQYHIDPATKDMFQYIFDTFDNGSYSIREFCGHLNEKGFRTTKDNRWTRATLHALLRNAFYTGKFVYKGVEYDGTHEAYFTTERLKARCMKLNTLCTAKRGREFLFKNFLTHGDFLLTGEFKKQQYTYYSNRTTGASFREETILKSLDDFIETVKFDERFSETLKILTKEIISERAKGHAYRSGNLQRKIQEIKAKKMRLLDSFAEDDIDKEAMQDLMAQYNGQIKFFEEQKKEVDIDTEAFYNTTVDVIDAVRNMPYIYAKITNPEDKIALLKGYMSRINITDEGLEPKWKMPFFLIYDVLDYRFELPELKVRKKDSMRGVRDSNSRPPA